MEQEKVNKDEKERQLRAELLQWELTRDNLSYWLASHYWTDDEFNTQFDLHKNACLQIDFLNKKLNNY